MSVRRDGVHVLVLTLLSCVRVHTGCRQFYHHLIEHGVAHLLSEAVQHEHVADLTDFQHVLQELRDLCGNVSGLGETQ